MNKGNLKLLGACGILLVGVWSAGVFADLSDEQHAQIDTHATHMAEIMKEKQVMPETLVALFDTVRVKVVENEDLLMMADALQDATMDAYYGVENFAQCEVYYDGCNECMKGDDGVMACTLKMCAEFEAPACLVYKNATEQEDLNTAMALWESMEPTSYTVEQQAMCFCTPEYTRPIRYEVVEGEVNTMSAVYVDRDEQEDDPDEVNLEMAPTLHSVEDMFDLIQEAIDANADKITVTYNSVYGYPESVMIDLSYMMADEEQSFTFTIAD